MKNMYIQRAIYNLNSDKELLKILKEVPENELRKARGGTITGFVQEDVSLLDLLAHETYIGYYLYQILIKKGLKFDIDEEIANFEIQSAKAIDTDTIESLEKQLIKFDHALIDMFKTMDTESFDENDFTTPRITAFMEQTTAGWIEHLLGHQIHHRGQMSQIVSELNIGTDISQFRIFGYERPEFND